MVFPSAFRHQTIPFNLHLCPEPLAESSTDLICTCKNLKAFEMFCWGQNLQVGRVWVMKVLFHGVLMLGVQLGTSGFGPIAALSDFFWVSRV